MAAPDEPRLVSLTLAVPAEAWARAGFDVEGDRARVGDVELLFEAPGERRGIVSWELAGAGAGRLDGLETGWAPVRVTPSGAGGARHPITATAIDHLVVFTSDLERTTAAFEEAGLRCRRRRQGRGPDGTPLEQAFFRAGPIIEAVRVPAEHAPPPAARFWGITFEVADLDGAVASLGSDGVGEPREAVQPGRRIATVRREAGLGIPVALITPDPRRG